MKYAYLILTLFACLWGANKTTAQQARIEGFIFTDQNANCLFDNAPDMPQIGIVVSATDSSTGSIFYANTDSNGFYAINNLPASTYSVRPHLPYNGLYYNLSCTTPSVVRPLTAQQTDTVSFPLAPLAIAPLVRADISSHHLVQCDTGKLLISCDNIGSQQALGVQIEVEIDPYLSFLSSQSFGLGNTTVSPSGNNRVLITIDSLSENSSPSARQLVVLDVFVSCNADIQQTHLSRLRLLNNDTFAVQPNYSDAILSVQKDSCTNTTDSVKFRIINPTTPTTQPYIVTQDNIMLRQGQAVLTGGSTQTITEASSLTSTYRLEVKQPSGIPAILGDSIAWEIAPSCAANDKLSSFTTWYYTGNSSPFVDTDARNNTAAFEPNSLTASPIGYDSAHFINQGTPIEYNIHIANTTAAPVSTVGVLLQLDTLLDLSTITPYAATHPYTWTLTGNNSLYFVFDNINLPNTTNLNATASLAFRILPKSQLPENSVISSNAIVQLGTNNITTNTIFHTIGGNNSFIRVLSFEHLQLTKTDIKVFPNPMKDRATLQFSSDKPTTASALKIYNAVGQNVLSATTTDNNFEIVRQNLPAGVYVYQIFDTNGALLGLGKLLLE
jgi:hypothetical protein